MMKEDMEDAPFGAVHNIIPKVIIILTKRHLVTMNENYGEEVA